MQKLTLPKIGQGMDEGVVLEWHVDEGDAVAAGDPLVTVETDKATSDVVADQNGTLLRRAVDVQETVPVGTVLGYVGEDESDLPDEDVDGRDDDGVAGREVDPAIEIDHESGSGVAGAIDDGGDEEADGDTGGGNTHGDASIGASPTARRIARERGVDLAAVRNALDVDQIRPPHIAEYVDHHATEDDTDSTATDGETEVLASPLARRVARENDVDVEAVGRHVERERIRKADVDTYLASVDEDTDEDELTRHGIEERASDGSTLDDRSPVPTVAMVEEGPAIASEQPVQGSRKAMFDRMSRVARDYADTTTVARVDVTRLWDRYRALSKTWPAVHDVDPSLTAFVVRAVTDCLPAAPTLNAELTDEETLRLYEDVNVGVAVATDDGTLVPTIPDADELTVRALSREIDRLAGAARDGGLTAEDMQRGTFTVSNAGSLGAYLNTPQIVPPQTAILGVCTMFDQPAVVDGEVVPRKMLHLCLTYDHRVIHGDTAVGFLRDVKALLEEPDSLLS